jgi:uncharacterized membrane protein
MIDELHESAAGAKAWTITLWGMLLLGPLVFFLSLLSIGVWLFGMGQGWWGVSENPPSDYVIFGPIIAVGFAEIIGALYAYAKRGKLTGTPFESHIAGVNHTLWIMIAGFAVATFLAFSLLIVPNIGAVGFGVGALSIMLCVLPLLFIWKTFHAVRGLRCALAGQPIADAR